MRYFFWFWFTVIRKAFLILTMRKQETKRAYKLTDAIEKQFEGTFRPATRRKIAISYGIYNHMICESFTGLYNRKTTPGEQKRFIYYFVFSSLFDDFTDDKTITGAQLFDISFKPAQYNAETFDEKAFLYAHQLLRDFVKDKTEYDVVFKALYDAQIASQQQFRTELTRAAIKDITFQKGGYAVLLCCFYFDFTAGDIERKCWYQIGVLIQLTNDLYDIHKDLKDEITTLPNSMTDVNEFETLFKKEVGEMKKLIAQLPFSSRNKKQFSLAMAGIYAFGFIAIRQLKQLQNSAGVLPDFKTLSRKQLIVDMEKKRNLILWFKFVYQYAKL